jgi:hypothetical protein
MVLMAVLHLDGSRAFDRERVSDGDRLVAAADVVLADVEAGHRHVQASYVGLKCGRKVKLRIIRHATTCT